MGTTNRSIRTFLAITSEVFRKNEVDEQFVETFPYYLGVAENAVQYVMDTQLDEAPMRGDMPTICHEQFTPETWEMGKIPTDWVFDHASRDVAEWIRKQWLTKQSDETIVRFYKRMNMCNRLAVFLANDLCPIIISASLFSVD